MNQAFFNSARTGCVAALLISSTFLLAAALAQDNPKAGPIAWSAPARAARKQNPIPSDENSRAQGKALFTVNCLPCHGPTGRGAGPASVSVDRNGAPLRRGSQSTRRS